MFIAANSFVDVAFFCSRTSRYAHFKNTPSALLFIRSESLLPNLNDGFGLNIINFLKLEINFVNILFNIFHFVNRKY